LESRDRKKDPKFEASMGYSEILSQEKKGKIG
jgi:hypothetical protein